MLDRLSIRSLVALVLVLAMSNWLFAASPMIGVAMAKGGFRVNDLNVTGNATLFDGAVVETNKASSSIRLESGATVSLEASSRSRLYQNRAVLERGRGEVTGSYAMEALGLRIESDASTSTARIALNGGKLVEVAAVTGNYRVTNAAGFLVGNVVAGHALAFEPQAAGAAAPSTLTGCMSKSEGKYYLNDETSGVKVQLLGSKLEAENGNRVEVVGTSTGSQQVQVNTMKRLSRGCAATAAGAAGAGKASAAAGKAAGAGMATGTKAIIAGIAVAAAAGTGAGVYQATRDDAPASSR